MRVWSLVVWIIYYINFDSCQAAKMSGIESGQCYCYNVSSLPTSVSSHFTSTSFPPFICMQDWPLLAAQHNFAKDNAENSGVFSLVVMMIDDRPVPSASSELFDIRLSAQEDKNSRESKCWFVRGRISTR